MRLLALGLALLATACTDGRSPLAADPLPDGAVDAARADAARDASAAELRHPTAKDNVVIPPAGQPVVRPEGEPSSADDLNALSQAAESGQPVAKPGAPPIKRLDAYRLRVGAVFVDRLHRFVRIPGRLNMTEGILEYYGVGTDGKLHESVLELLVEPSHLHLALLLIGMEPRQYGKPKDQFSPPPVTREGSRVELHVEWTDPKTNEKRRDPAEIWLYDRRKDAAPPAQIWIFQGSQFWQNRYTADLERSMIGVVPDFSAVVTIGSSAGNPYQGDGLGFEVYKKAVPPKGTQVDLVITAYGVKKPTVGPDGKPVPGALPPRSATPPPATPPPAKP